MVFIGRYTRALSFGGPSLRPIGTDCICKASSHGPKVSQLPSRLKAGLGSCGPPARSISTSSRRSGSDQQPSTKRQGADARRWHSPLTNRSEQIRLLQLPSELESDGRIRVSIRTYALNDIPPYQALSYRWGSPYIMEQETQVWERKGEDLRIVCNGHEVSIQQNLFEALQRLIQLAPGSLLWVDAICIDQGDQREKAAQIFLMDRIYSQAAQVVVWLGPTAEPAGSVLAAVYRYFESTQQPWSENIDLENMATIDLREWISTNLQQLQEALPDRAGGSAHFVEMVLKFVLLGIHDIMHRSWWFRTWTYQEMVLAKSMVLVYGTRTFHPEKLRLLASHVLRPGVLSPETLDHFTQLSGRFGELEQSTVLEKAFFSDAKLNANSSQSDADLTTVRHIMQRLNSDGGHSFGIILLMLTIMTRMRQATEPKDKVRALVGIAQAVARRLNVNIDGTFSILKQNGPLETVPFFSEPHRYILKQDVWLETLRYVKKYENFNHLRFGGWPDQPESWCPDFSDDNVRRCIRVTGDSACGNWVPGFFGLGLSRDFSTSIMGYFPVFMLLGHETFHLRGIRIGSVDAVVPVPGIPPNRSTFQESVAAQWRSIQAMLQFCRHLPRRYAIDQDLKHRLWTTLTLNATSFSADEFQNWVAYTNLLFYVQGSGEERDSFERELAVSNAWDRSRFLGFDFGPKILRYIKEFVEEHATDGSSPDLVRPENLSALAAIQQGSNVALPEHPYHLFTVNRELVGSTPATACLPGDQLWLLEGARHPFILRPRWIPGYYYLIGEAYVDGIMRGELLEKKNRRRWSRPWWERIALT